jgi:hypothetical protein
MIIILTTLLVLSSSLLLLQCQVGDPQQVLRLMSWSVGALHRLTYRIMVRNITFIAGSRMTLLHHMTQQHLSNVFFPHLPPSLLH